MNNYCAFIILKKVEWYEYNQGKRGYIPIHTDDLAFDLKCFNHWKIPVLAIFKIKLK